MSGKIENPISTPEHSVELPSNSDPCVPGVVCDGEPKEENKFSDLDSRFLLEVLVSEKAEKCGFTNHHSLVQEPSSRMDSYESEIVSDMVVKKDESFSDVDSDWDEEDIQLLRFLKDPKNELKLWPKKLLSKFSQNDLYLAKVRQILNEVKDWKKIYELLMEDFRNDSRIQKMKQDLASSRREVKSLKKAYRDTMKKLKEREESYQQVQDERDVLQQKVTDNEQRLLKMSEELQAAQQERLTQHDQEKQHLQNRVSSLEGEKAKLEHFKMEAEKLRSQKQSLIERNKTLQDECQHLLNQLHQVSEGDMLKLGVLDQLISAKKEQISILQRERDDLERKNLEQLIATSSVYRSSGSLLLSPEANRIERNGRLLENTEGWRNQQLMKANSTAVSRELQKDTSTHENYT